MNAAEKLQLIEMRLTQAFNPTMLQVLDESDAHRGHAGHGGGGRHFAVIITSDFFQGKSRVAGHRAIYDLFPDLIPDEIHALRIVINAP